MTATHNSPYLNLPAKAYWKSGVAERQTGDPGDLFQPRFPISRTDRIVTAGSCFAQHVGRTLRNAGFNVLDAEPLPGDVPDSIANALGYRLYSARYGNVYTARQLLQLTREATGEISPKMPVWEKDGRFYDAQRPGIERHGHGTAEDVLKHRRHHLERVNALFQQADVFVFTFGLTEAWVHKESQTVFPTAPGTIAGEFDPEVFEFKNFDVFEVLEDFRQFREMMMHTNPDIRFIVTVSPVPLTATASQDHVEVATGYSKAVLRATCGQLKAAFDNVDYFPSYEIITSQTAGGGYYMPNMRSVTDQGVATAMGLFMRANGFAVEEPESPEGKRGKGNKPHAGQRRGAANRRGAKKTEDEVCEDALLEAFAK